MIERAPRLPESSRTLSFHVIGATGGGAGSPGGTGGGAAMVTVTLVPAIVTVAGDAAGGWSTTVNDTDAPWRTAALQGGPVLSIQKSDFAMPQGIRDIDYDAARQEFLVVVGRSISGGRAPFQLCTWDGNASAVNVLDVTFQPESSTKPETKPEGITAFPGHGARRLLIVDDNGGFAVLNSV